MKRKKSTSEIFEIWTAKINQKVEQVEKKFEALEDERDKLRQDKLQIEDRIMNSKTENCKRTSGKKKKE